LLALEAEVGFSAVPESLGRIAADFLSRQGLGSVATPWAVVCGREGSGGAGSGAGLAACPAHARPVGKISAATSSAEPANRALVGWWIGFIFFPVKTCMPPDRLALARKTAFFVRYECLTRISDKGSLPMLTKIPRTHDQSGTSRAALWY
jgi:hypothetical protein